MLAKAEHRGWLLLAEESRCMLDSSCWCLSCRGWQSTGGLHAASAQRGCLRGEMHTYEADLQQEHGEHCEDEWGHSSALADLKDGSCSCFTLSVDWQVQPWKGAPQASEGWKVEHASGTVALMLAAVLQDYRRVTTSGCAATTRACKYFKCLCEGAHLASPPQ